MDNRRVRASGLAFAALLAGTLITAGCGAGEPPALAIGDVGYTAIELELLSPADRDRLVELTAFGLAVSRDEVDRVTGPMVEQGQRSLLLQKLMTEIAARSIGVADEALRAAYAADPDWELEVRHIVLLSERWRPPAERDRARARAERILERVRAGADFAALAAQYSEEPGADRRGGLLQPGREGTWVQEFWEAANALEVGGTSGVVESEYGFHVIRLEDRRPVPFEEARDRALGRLVDLAGAAERAEAWADEETALLRLHPETIEAFREGKATPDAVLVSWPGGEYRAEAFERHLIGADITALRRMESTSAAALRNRVYRAARHAVLVERAGELGIALDIVEAGTVSERWERRSAGWAEALGFRTGAHPEQIKTAALAALSAQGQNAQIAREELLEYAPILRRLYPVERADGNPTET